MQTERVWFGNEEYKHGDTPVLLVLRGSCMAGNFKPPYGDRGYWVQYDVNNPRIPWFVHGGQRDEPWTQDRQSR